MLEPLASYLCLNPWADNLLQNIILSQKPAISTTISSLPTALLEQLLSELSTLASVYHKPPESFVGKGRFGADEIQRAAIQEQRREAADNPIAASVAAAAANGAGGAQPQSNVENLLDIDFDGAAPASQEQASAAATPDRVASPAVGAGASSSGGMADMMGLFDVSSPATPSAAPPMGGGGAMGDMMNGFAGMDLSGTSAPPPPGQQLHPQGTGGQQPPQQSGGGGGSDDLLGLF